MQRLKRIASTSSADGVAWVRVDWCRDWEEYQVRAYLGGKLVAEYSTDDKQDALGTAAAMLAQLGHSA